MKKRNPVFYVLLLTPIIMLWVSSNISWGKDHWRGILESDAKGYYAYLPASFIYKDLNYGFFDSIEKGKYYDEHYFYDYTTGVNGHRVNRYWCGTALCEAPFFLVAHTFAKISGADADGFSRPYMIAVNLAAVFYLLTGLVFVSRLLALYNISEWNRAIVLALIAFGTNLFYYSVVEPGMSHVFAFCAISAFLYQLKQLTVRFETKRLLFAAVLFALIFLIRPLNILCVLTLPFIAASKERLFSFFKSLFQNLPLLIIALGICSGLMFVQALFFKLSSGQFVIDSYPGEHFNFADPHLLDILFSYRKGLFLYTPLYFVSLAGLYFFFRKSVFAFSSFLIFFVVLTYIFSSWWSWWYGGSFSSRVYVDYLPLFAVLLGTAFQSLSGAKRKILIAFSFVLLLFCQVQIYQYRYDQIHWDGMTKEKYWNVFLRVDKIG